MRGEDNLYQRAGIWWLRAEVGGREYRESLRTRDVKSARRLRDARLKAISGAVWHGERHRPWVEAVTEWLEHATGQLGASTLKRYAVSLAQCEPLLAQFDIDKIDGRAIAGLIQNRRLTGATPATVRRDLTAVSRVLEYAEAMEWREGNPTLSKRKILKERRDPIELPTETAIDSMIAGSSKRFGALIVAARLTGCRQNELVSLEPRQFSAKSGTLDVIGKGNKRRTISLSRPAKAHFAKQAMDGKLIFCKEDGEAFAQAASDFTHFRREVEKREPGFKRFRFHDLRHLFAVEALRGGMSIYALSKHLGHTSVKTTEIYLSFLTGEEAESARESAQKPAQSAQRGKGKSSQHIDI
ncbi:MAG: site-specific integrase [Roseiarcus sp.]|jgi:integrase/recombinase XerD